MVDQVDVRSRDVRGALDAIVKTNLSVAAVALAGLLAAFVLLDPLTVRPDAVFRVLIVDALLGFAFLGAAVALREGYLTARHANHLGAGLGMLTTINILHDAWLLEDPVQTTYLMLVALGVGSLILSARAFWATMAVVVVGWVAVVVHAPSDGWTEFGLALLAAIVLGAVLHTVRLQMHTRMEHLRLIEEQGQLELQEAFVRVQASEDRYRQLVEQAPHAFLVHQEGRVVYVNLAAVRLFGARSSDEMMGMDSMSLVHPEHRETVRERNRQIELEGRDTEPMEMKVQRLDGGVTWVEAMGHPIEYNDGVADQTVIHDISDRKRIHEERDVAAARLREIESLREMDRVKTDFVNAISHELRTPLTPIKVQLHLLREARGEPERTTRAIAVLDRNLQRLTGLVDELLEVASIQAGTLKLSRTHVDLDSTLLLALDSFIDVAETNGVALDSDLGSHATILGDPKRITQVLYNLMSNALKFTPRDGQIIITSRILGDEVIVSVTDSGHGISPEGIDRLFRPFSQAHEPDPTMPKGTGLGLFISKGIIEGHDGRIWCESKGPGMGATFAFALPRHPLIQETRLGTAASRGPGAPSP